MRAFWRRLVCRIDGHQWHRTYTLDWWGRELEECERCGAGRWRTAR